LEALRRIGILGKMVQVNREPEFAVRKGGWEEIDGEKAKNGDKGRVPLSPYLFTIVMTVMISDFGTQMTDDERAVMVAKQPFDMSRYSMMLYADDTVILTSTAEAARLILH